jgi:hypothetical protein
MDSEEYNMNEFVLREIGCVFDNECYGSIWNQYEKNSIMELGGAELILEDDKLFIKDDFKFADELIRDYDKLCLYWMCYLDRIKYLAILPRVEEKKLRKLVDKRYVLTYSELVIKEIVK